MALLTRIQGELAYQRVRRTMDDERWGCGESRHRSEPVKLATKPSSEWTRARKADVGDSVFGGGVVLKDLPGAGRVYDWRDSTFASCG